MSDLQIALIIIGALIIAAVVVLNWWQERRFHQQVASSFTHVQSDALLDDPKLDLSKLNDELDDFSDQDFEHVDLANNHFATPHPQPDADLTLDRAAEDEDRFVKLDEGDSAEQITEEASIEAVYSELTHKADESSQVPALETTLQSASLNTEIKPAQHQEIKAIFDEVFSNASSGILETSNITNDKSYAKAVEEPILSLPAMLHAQMDLTAVIYLATESTVGELSNALKGLFDGYEKPVYVHVLDENKQWVLVSNTQAKPVPDQPISRLACSLQLADRAGAVSRNMLNRFQLTVETLGLDLNAHVEWQSSGDALTAATTLDAFCIEVDKTMGFHLVHGDNGAFTGTKLRGLAEAQGLTLASDGTFKYFDESTIKQNISPQLPSFVMFNRDQNPFSPDMLRTSVVKAVTFQLDIPHVKHCAEAFNHMVQVAKQMESGLNAVLVDDNNRVLSDIQIEKIRQQLKVIHATMLVRGIVPGSDSALRLFS